MLSRRCVGTFGAVTDLDPTTIELWVLRLVWLVLPFTAGPLFADALGDTDQPFRSGVSIGLWVVWALMLVALMVPRTQTLTALRIVGPAVPLGALWAALAGDATSATITVAWVASVIVAFGALRATIGDAFVDGSSYGDESRFLLRTPGALLMGPLAVLWIVVVAGAVAGPLLLLAEWWVLGGIVLVLGWPLTFFGAQAIHRLSTRWLVFVPAGLVVHDKTALREPQLFRMEDIAVFGPAPVDSEEEDLTMAAPGLVLRIALNGESKIIKNTRDDKIELTEVDGLLVTPNRPGAVLEEATGRGLTIG